MSLWPHFVGPAYTALLPPIPVAGAWGSGLLPDTSTRWHLFTARARKLYWTELTCNKSTQLHDAFIGRARRVKSQGACLFGVPLGRWFAGARVQLARVHGERRQQADSAAVCRSQLPTLAQHRASQRQAVQHSGMHCAVCWFTTATVTLTDFRLFKYGIKRT